MWVYMHMGVVMYVGVRACRHMCVCIFVCMCVSSCVCRHVCVCVCFAGGNLGQIQQSIAGRPPVVFNIGGGAPRTANTRQQGPTGNNNPLASTVTAAPSAIVNDAATNGNGITSSDNATGGGGSGGAGVDVYFNLPVGGNALATSSLDCSNKPRLVPML
jgi:hypothetical protein